MVAPVYSHPDGKIPVAYEHRIHMTRLLLESLPRHRVSVSFYERLTYEKYGNCHTANTLKLIVEDSGPDDVIVLVLGGDIKYTYPGWVGHKEIQKLIESGRVELLWLDRDSWMSSTLIRAAIKDRRNIDGFVPVRIRDFIDENKLYL
jgi:nicotinic acid mononucleotide adenylyltransferase